MSIESSEAALGMNPMIKDAIHKIIPPVIYTRVRRRLEKLVNTSKAQIVVMTICLRDCDNVPDEEQHTVLRRLAEQLHEECIGRFARMNRDARHGKHHPCLICCPDIYPMYVAGSGVGPTEVVALSLVWITDYVACRSANDAVLKLLPEHFWDQCDLLYAAELSHSVSFAMACAFAGVWEERIPEAAIFSLPPQIMNSLKPSRLPFKRPVGPEEVTFMGILDAVEYGVEDAELSNV